MAGAAAGLWFDARRILGLSGLVGLLGLCVAFGCWWMWVRGSEELLRQLRQEIHVLQVQSRNRPAPVHVPTTGEQLRTFLAYFPPRTQISIALDKFSRLAAANQLTLPSGEYKLTVGKDLPLAHYEIHFPVRGSYGHIYSLVAAALNAMPNLALDEIAIKRESRTASEIEAQLRFSLYLKQD
jgi:hypothetical protein